MGERDDSSTDGDAIRVTARQLEVLKQIAAGEPTVPVEGKRIDLTVNSLLKRGLAEPVAGASPGEPTCRPTTDGLSLLEAKASVATAVEKGPTTVKEDQPADVAAETIDEKERSRPNGKSARPASRSVAPAKPKFVPVVGSIVWVRDQDGTTNQVDHRVRAVIADKQQALLSVRFGQVFKDLPMPFHWSRLMPPTGKT